MNRSKIEWCDHTWNPITGCRHDCEYCYARRMTARFAGDVRLNKMAKKDYSLVPAADSGEKIYVLDAPMMNETGNKLAYPFGFEPTLHRYRMDYLGKLKMGNNIFVGAMSDIFGKWVPDEWIKEVLDICMENPIHNYLFLTKNPNRYLEFFLRSYKEEYLAENMWYGTTVTRAVELKRTGYLPKSDCGSFVSIEPILENIQLWTNEDAAKKLEWIIVGAQTGRAVAKVVPKKEWIDDIVSFADKYDIPVFMKDSLIPIVGEENMRRDFPRQLQHSKISPKMEKKLYDACAECNIHLKKSDMITLLARSKRGEQPKQFGFMCKGCFKDFCEQRRLILPKLTELTGISIGTGDGDD